MAEEWVHVDALPEEEEEIGTTIVNWLKTSPLDFYPTSEDGVQLKWARHVNTRAALENALSGTDEMLEADIVMSKKYSPSIPVMGQPNSDESDIKLHKWLRKVRRNRTKGILLHFHSEDVIEPALKHIRSTRVLAPTILCAEVFQAEETSPPPINAEHFLGACRRRCPNAFICLGWTANISDMIAREVGYSDRNISQIISLLDDFEVINHVLFSVHLMLLKRSIAQIQQLLHLVPNSSLYVWTDNRIQCIEDVLLIRMHFDKKRVLYSIPDLHSFIYELAYLRSN